MQLFQDIISQDDLRKAIKQNQFILYFQPQFNIDTASFGAIEVLARWQHPNKGLLMPDDFIPAIETKNMMPIFGEWILESASHQYLSWQKKGLAPFRMAVNVSWTQVNENDFLDMIRRIKKQGNFPDQLLELELTENIVLHMNESKMIQTVLALKNEGVSIALDDFGTGYASIGHLKSISFNRIKIDKSYIQNIHKNKEDLAILRAILSVGESLHMNVVAEGVESQKHMQILSQAGCREMQGFYFSEPLTAEELEKFMIFYQNNTFL